MSPIPLEIIGFHCQQAVEKHPKAFLIANDRIPDKTHDSLFLLRECSVYDQSFRDLAPACASLSEYDVRTRYPHPGKLDEGMIHVAIDQAVNATALVRLKLEGLNSP